MKKKMLDLLKCINCDSTNLSLEVAKETNSEIVEGVIKCADCGAVYPITNGIPRFSDKKGKLTHKDDFDKNTKNKFEFAWNNWGEDAVIFGRTYQESKDFFFDYSGKAITPEYLKGKITVDAGCGHGRFTEIMAEAGAYAIGLDLGHGVDIAKSKVQGKGYDIDFVQGNVLYPPFRDEVIDFIWSNGVLHHTYSTRKAFDAVAKAVKKGGYFNVWFYPKEGFLWEISQKSLRFITTKLPPRLLYYMTYLAVPLLAFVKTYSGTRWPKNKWSECARVIYDWYSPKYQWHHTNKEVAQWFVEDGFDDIEILDLRVTVTGRKK